jgi:hypothetical protein
VFKEGPHDSTEELLGNSQQDSNKKTENTFTDVDFSQLDRHGTLDCKETTILSVAREQKQSKRKQRACSNLAELMSLTAIDTE